MPMRVQWPVPAVARPGRDSWPQKVCAVCVFGVLWTSCTHALVCVPHAVPHCKHATEDGSMRGV